MDKKTLNIVLSLALIGAFFLPYISFGGFNASGFNVVFGKDGMSGLFKSGALSYLCLLVPIGAIVILFDSLGNEGSSMADYGYWMPLLGIIILSVLMFTGMNTGARGALTLSLFFKVMGYGYWITVAASVAVLVNKSRT